MAGHQKALRGAIHDALAALPDDALVGLVSYDSTAMVLAPLAVLDRPALAAKVNALRPGGGSDLVGGVKAAREAVRIAPPSAMRAVLVLADGDAVVDGLDDALAATLADRITVSTFALDGADRGTLDRIADHTGGTSYEKLRSSELARAYTKEIGRLLGGDDGGKPRPGGRPGSGKKDPPGAGSATTTTTTTVTTPDPKPDPTPTKVPGDLDGDGIPDER